MNSEHANYRKVLAAFLEEIPQNKGWWYRLPLAPTSSKNGKSIATDVILPPLGNVFGLTEPAMLLFLVEMGCYKARGEGYTINGTGWEAFEAEFKVKKYIEVSKTSFDKGNGINLIRLGFPKHSPSVIWKMYGQGNIKAPPRVISSYASAKFAKKEFFKVFKGSKLYMDVLKLHVGGYLKGNGIEDSALVRKNRHTWSHDDENHEEEEIVCWDQQQQVQQQEPQEEQKQEEEEAEEEEEQPITAAALAVNLTAGTVADPQEFPVMNAFKIPGDNMQALTQLHKEVTRRMQQLQIESGQEQVCKGSVLYEDGKHLRLFVEIPKGILGVTMTKMMRKRQRAIELGDSKSGRQHAVVLCLVFILSNSNPSLIP